MYDRQGIVNHVHVDFSRPSNGFGFGKCEPYMLPNLEGEIEMSNQLLTVPLLLSVLAGSSGSAESKSCVVAAQSPLFGALVAPESASNESWRALHREMRRLIRECPGGPSNPESRRLLLQFIERYLDLDLTRLMKVWDQQRQSLSEGGLEAMAEGRNDLRTYFDDVVAGDEQGDAYRVVLKHGSGKAIAKLGPRAKKEVLKSAATKGPKSRPFYARHDQQVSALETLGFWIDPNETRFSAAEKSEFSDALMSAIPPPSHIPGGMGHTLARKALTALAKSDQENTQKRVLKWANERGGMWGPDDEFALLAQKALNDIEKRIRPPQKR